MSSLQSRIAELDDDVTSLSEHYAAWHLLAHPEERAQYSEAIARNEAFFQSTAHAHFICVAVSTYRLMDIRSDSNSVPNVLSEIEPLYPAFVAGIRGRLKPSVDVFDRIASIRHKVYAHRDKALGPDVIFRVAKLTPELIGHCVALLEEAVDALSAQCLPSQHEGAVIVRSSAAADEIRDSLREILAAL